MHVRYFYLFIGLGSFLASLSLRADETQAAEDITKPQGDVEIRQRIIGTWTSGGSFTNTNEFVSFSQTLTYSTNGYYSAVKTVNSGGRTSVEKCEGTWSLQNRFLTYSITNSIGDQSGLDSLRFFYPQARVIHVSGEHLHIFEGTDRFAAFERDSTANNH
jgi:hypothetical protein